MSDNYLDEKQQDCWDEGFNDLIESETAYGAPLPSDLATREFGPTRSDISVQVIIHKNPLKKIKPRRGTPEVSADDFFSSLVKSTDGRWFFSGILNGWGGLNLLELVTLEAPSTNMLKGTPKLKKYWNNHEAVGFDPNIKTVPSHGSVSMLRKGTTFMRGKRSKGSRMKVAGIPKFASGSKAFVIETIRATLYLPKYKEDSYSKDNPGNVWYYAGGDGNEPNPKFAHGANAIAAAELHDRARHQGRLPQATSAHHFGHRYAKVKESARDRIIYHTGIFLEWDHGEYGTIIELAWKNGIGGYKGMSNWVEDRDAKPSSTLYKQMPGCCKLPWEPTRSEVRIIDIPVKNVEEFKQYLNQYTGPTLRFLDPKVKFSEKVLLRDRSKPALCRYMINRMMANQDYSEPSITSGSKGYNCQTFAASLFGFLTNSHSRLFSIKFSASARQKMFALSYVDGKPMPIEYEQSKSKGSAYSRKKANSKTKATGTSVPSDLTDIDS